MNPWITHCKSYHNAHPSLKWSEVLKNAKSSYKKVGKKCMKGKGIVDTLTKDFKDAKIGSKTLDYLSDKVKLEGYGKKRRMMRKM